MNDCEHPDRRDEILGDDDDTIEKRATDDLTDDLTYERIIPRVLRNMLVVSVLLLGPAFWFYRWAGSIGFAFGAAVSYVNFRSLTRGVEGLADRIVNQNSREKGGWIVLRFVSATGWWQPLPMLYSSVLPWRFAAFCGACVCRWQP
jgi:hypothetical protein